MPCHYFSNPLKYSYEVNGFSFMASDKHRPSAYHYTRDIKSHSRHHHTWDNFVTVRYKHKTIKRVSLSHNLHRVTDKLTRTKRIFHALMPHRYTIAYSNCWKFHRRSARHSNAVFHCLAYSIQMHVPRYQFICRIGNADYMLFKLLP